MALINHEKKEINAKIVYYGPGSSGKTSNIKYIYEKMKPEFRGKLKLLNTNSGKMLFFDFMRPDQIGIRDYAVRFHIYTVPGEISDFSVWKTVLKGTDGLVFVADSGQNRFSDNLQSFEKLNEYLDTFQDELRDFPLILQCNKQDLPGAASIEEMKDLLHTTDLPTIPASTKKGEGILNTLSTIVKMVIQKLQQSPPDVTEENEASAVELDNEQSGLPEQNVFSGVSLSPMPTAMNEEEALQPVIEPAVKLDISPDTNMEINIGEQPADAVEIQESGNQFAEISLPDEIIRFDEAPLTELSIVEEESVLEPVQLQMPAQELSFASGEGIPAPEPSTETVGFDGTEPIAAEIDFAGDIKPVAPGHFLLPVVIKFGRETKTVDIDLKLSVAISQN